MKWGDKPYHSLDYYMKKRFGEKVYRLSLNAGLTCPNRDGTLAHSGCIFCSQGGSGDFAAPSSEPIAQQIAAAKALISKKTNCRKYLAYFHAYTNTYGPIPYLRRIFMDAIRHPDIVGLFIATRPDCLPDEVLALLAELNVQKPLWLELGLQTIHAQSHTFIRSGFSLSCFETAVANLKSIGIPVIIHVILGLQGETTEQMLETIDYLAHLGIHGIKLHLLHILIDTDLYAYYQKHPFPLFTLEEYCDILCRCIEHLPPDVVIHRLTGDGPKKLLAAPLWSADKKRVLNTIHKTMKEQHSWQGKSWQASSCVTEAYYGRSADTI